MKKILALIVSFLILASVPAHAETVPISINSPMSTPLSATTASSRVEYGTAGTALFIVDNTGAVPVFCKSGSITVTAATTDRYIAPTATSWVFSKSKSDTHLACITASGAATVYVQAGNGD